MKLKLCFVFKCISSLSSESRKEMVAIKIKSPMKAPVNLKGEGCRERVVMEFVSFSGGGEGMKGPSSRIELSLVTAIETYLSV